MSKTPTRSTEAAVNFSPRELTTPGKDCSDISKTVFRHVSSLHGLLSDWMQVRDKGIKILRGVSSLKLHECLDDYYPHQLQPLMESLLGALESLENIVEGIRLIYSQLQAVAKLHPLDTAVICTWSATRISEEVGKIYMSLQKEYSLKATVTENLAHCRDEGLIEVYLSSWEFEPYLEMDSIAYLFAEVGLSSIK